MIPNATRIDFPVNTVKLLARIEFLFSVRFFGHLVVQISQRESLLRRLVVVEDQLAAVPVPVDTRELGDSTDSSST